MQIGISKIQWTLTEGEKLKPWKVVHEWQPTNTHAHAYTHINVHTLFSSPFCFSLSASPLPILQREVTGYTGFQNNKGSHWLLGTHGCHTASLYIVVLSDIARTLAMLLLLFHLLFTLKRRAFLGHWPFLQGKPERFSFILFFCT